MIPLSFKNLFSKHHVEDVIEESPHLEENSPPKIMAGGDPVNLTFNKRLEQ